jgi:hypothetical protein
MVAGDCQAPATTSNTMRIVGGNGGFPFSIPGACARLRSSPKTSPLSNGRSWMWLQP